MTVLASHFLTAPSLHGQILGKEYILVRFHLSLRIKKNIPVMSIIEIN